MKYCNITRRHFLADMGMGLTGVVLGSMLAQEKAHGQQSLTPNPSPSGRGGNTGPHFPPKAKSVIWIFLCGGVSHVESFDVKSELNRYAGMTIANTPHRNVLQFEGQGVIAGNPSHGNRHTLMGLNTGYRPYGQSGLVVADWWRHIGECADDIAVVRSLWTNHNDHGAQLTWHTGRHVREGAFPTIGSWINYGLGTLNQNLPQYVVLGTPTGDCCGGSWTHGSSYLGPEYAGVRLNVGARDPLPFVTPGMSQQEQQAEFGLINRLNRLSGVEYPDDPALRARIRAYELAAGMQTAIPETLQFTQETEATRQLYGMNDMTTQNFGQLCLAARRLVERGVRYVQLFHGGGGGGAWDAHSGIRANHSNLSSQVDLPIAGLLKDLKQRGMLEDTLVVWGTEFGRSPGAQGDGRDHHPMGFCAWLAGGGIKGGVVHGATDELGFYAVENRHYITDIHATVMHQLGIDARRLEVPGRRRLDIDYGTPIREIIA